MLQTATPTPPPPPPVSCWRFLRAASGHLCTESAADSWVRALSGPAVIEDACRDHLLPSIMLWLSWSYPPTPPALLPHLQPCLFLLRNERLERSEGQGGRVLSLTLGMRCHSVTFCVISHQRLLFLRCSASVAVQKNFFKNNFKLSDR